MIHGRGDCEMTHPAMMRADSSSTMMLTRPEALMMRPTTVTPAQPISQESERRILLPLRQLCISSLSLRRDGAIRNAQRARSARVE